MLITIVFAFGWDVYTSSENYVSYRLAANQITKLMSDTCNFIEKVHSINKFNLNKKIASHLSVKVFFVKMELLGKIITRPQVFIKS
ncbi:hypothetical protein SODG_006006 [Sodalis praecaptivus]